MLNNFLTGLGLVLSGLGCLTKKGIRPFVVVPFIINLVVFSLAIKIAWQQFGYLFSLMATSLPGWLIWLQWALWPLAALLIATVVYFSFTLVANIMAAPFNALLSERVEHLLSDQPIKPFAGFKTIPSLIGRTLWSELRKIAYQVKWLLALVVLTFIPGLNLIAPFAWIYFGIWALSIEYGEYPMGNHGLYFRQVKAALKKDRALSLGMGTGIMLLTLIPGVNFIAMPAGVASGTALWVKQITPTTKYN